jgi:hypothetical protein
VRADRRGGRRVEGIEYAHRVRGIHQLADLLGVQPPDRRSFARGGWRTRTRTAAEDQRDDPSLEVLVHAAQAFDDDLEARLLANLATQPVLNRLFEFEDTTGWLPLGVVPPLDRQNMSRVVDDRGGDAHGMPRRGLGHTRLLG